MDYQEAKMLPHGISEFRRIMTGGLYYVDKTTYRPKLEQTANRLLITRPRHLGKGLLVSMMSQYGDMSATPR